MEGDTMESGIFIVQRRSLIHCARGPRGCERCRDMAGEQVICLVELYPGPTGVARPVDEFELNGEKGFCEFDIVRRFENEEAAEVFADSKSIPVDLP